MNKTPSILIDTGFEVDQNGIMTGLIIPKVVNTLNSPANVTFMGTVITWVPASSGILEYFSAPNITTFSPGTLFGNAYNKLKTVKLEGLSTLPSTGSTAGLFYGNIYLQNVQLGSIGHPVSSIGNYHFYNCNQSSLTITVYTADGNAIAGSPWGATNATIVWEEA